VPAADPGLVPWPCLGAGRDRTFREAGGRLSPEGMRALSRRMFLGPAGGPGYLPVEVQLVIGGFDQVRGAGWLEW
jgi:hypothetical protein